MNRLSFALGAPGLLINLPLTPLILFSESLPLTWILLVPYSLGTAMFLVGLGANAAYKGRHPCWSFLALFWIFGLFVFLFLSDRRARRLRELESQYAEPVPIPSTLVQHMEPVFPPRFWVATGLAIVPLLAPIGLILAIVEIAARDTAGRGKQWWAWGTAWTGYQSFVLMFKLVAMLAYLAGMAPPSEPQVLSDGVFQLTVPAGWVENPELAESVGAQIGTSDLVDGLHLLVFGESKKDLIELTPHQYATVIIDQLEPVLADFKRGELQDIRIGGYPAIQVEVEWVEEHTRGRMLLTFIETPTHYCQVRAFGVRSSMAASLDSLRGITATFVSQ